MLPLMAEEIDEQEHGGRKQEEAIELVSALMFIERSGEERLFRLSLIERVEDIDIAHFGHSGGRWFVRIDGRVLPVVHGLENAGAAPLPPCLCGVGHVSYRSEERRGGKEWGSRGRS